MNRLPVNFPGLNDTIYAGFSPRILSLILDAIICLPFLVLIEYINGLSRTNIFYTFIFSFSFFFYYHVYCVKQWGGSPGKLIMNIKIIKLDGRPAEWEQAILRHIVSIIYSVISLILILIAISKISDDIFDKMNYMQRNLLISSLSPIPVKVISLFNTIWVLSEFIVLLFNPRKMALHDYIAKTVVIKGKYYKRLQNWLDMQNGYSLICPGCGKKRIVKNFGKFQCSACSTKFVFDNYGIRLYK